MHNFSYLTGFNVSNMESKPRRARKPNWTEEQCLLLAQLVDEHKAILKGKFWPGVTARDKKQTWERIAQTINGSFPLLVRTYKPAIFINAVF